MRCFVISPIGKEGSPDRKHADKVLKYLIEPALAEFNIQAVRSDHMSNPGRISDQMYRAIFESDLCIAVLTFQNPNVYYELAVAQSASRPVIVLADENTTLPFDLKDFRTIVYDLEIDSYTSRTHINRLVAALEAFKQSGWIGDDVFGPYRKVSELPQALNTTQFEITITSPVKDAVVDIVKVEGTYKSLPPGYELRTLRYYPDNGGFVPNGSVVVDQLEKSWRVARFDIGGTTGVDRGIEIALAGPNAKALLDYWLEAHGVHSSLRKEYKELGGKSWEWLPAIPRHHRPTDLWPCDRVDVKRK